MMGLISIALFVVWIFQGDRDVLLLGSGLFAIADSIDSWYRKWKEIVDSNHKHVKH